jgi:hypothetical protein
MATICDAPTRSSSSPGSRNICAVERLDRLARQRFGKRVIHLVARWMLEGSSSRRLRVHLSQQKAPRTYVTIIPREPSDDGEASQIREHPVAYCSLTCQCHLKYFSDVIDV